MPYGVETRAPVPMDAESRRIQATHGLTSRQAIYVKNIAIDGARSNREAVRRAGYASSEAVTKARKSARVQKALREEAERALALAQKKGELLAKISENPKEAVKGELAMHAVDPDTAPNQTRAVELIGKLEGVFIEKIEIDPGEFMRSRFARDLMGEGEDED